MEGKSSAERELGGREGGVGNIDGGEVEEKMSKGEEDRRRKMSRR